MRPINDNPSVKQSSVITPSFDASARVPRLLVSVRSVEESMIAIQGGCDILDVKEPSRGSLGMAASDTLRQIARSARRQAPEIILTAALGEVHEFTLNPSWDLPGELNLVKLGCARLGNDHQWRQKWGQVRETISRAFASPVGWVAVAYADWQLAQAPSPREIIAAAIMAGCQGVLFDTYTKSDRRLLDWISVSELQQAAEQVHAAGMFLALAGSLRCEDLSQLSQISADVLAIRGAACIGGRRTDAIQESAIRDFRAAMQDFWAVVTPALQSETRHSASTNSI